MSGHSQFHNIMYRKGAQDAKRAKAFAKLGREILVAAKLGSADPQANPRLRAALVAARAENMPKDNIDRILKKAAGPENGANYEDVRFEGFGPGGVAVIVEALTDNRNRTVPEVRSTFSKFGGNLGDVGSVSFMFKRVGQIHFSKDSVSFDRLFDKAVEAGADDVEEWEDAFVVTCSVEVFGPVRDFLAEQIGEPLKSGLVWTALNETDCSIDTMRTLLKLLDALEDNDDVQKVFSNATCSEDVQKQLDAELGE